VSPAEEYRSEMPIGNKLRLKSRDHPCQFVKADYLELAYLQQTLGILQQTSVLTSSLGCTVHYQVGQGMQQDVLQAQVSEPRL